MTGLRFEHLTRRQLLASAFGAVFWNQKDPSDWSAEEVHQILNKSPWTKPVTVVPPIIPTRFSPSSGGTNTTQGDRSGPGDVGQVGRPNNVGDEPPNRSIRPIMPGEPHKGIVRWESAKPVLAATRKTLPAAFAGRYVISVSGFPMGDIVSASGVPKLSDRDLERITAASFLATKEKNVAPAQLSRMIEGAVWIGFSRSAFPLSSNDKEVAFATTLGRLEIKTKFNLKEMIYQGALAI